MSASPQNLSPALAPIATVVRVLIGDRYMTATDPMPIRAAMKWRDEYAADAEIAGPFSGPAPGYFFTVQTPALKLYRVVVHGCLLENHITDDGDTEVWVRADNESKIHAATHGIPEISVDLLDEYHHDARHANFVLPADVRAFAQAMHAAKAGRLTPPAIRHRPRIIAKFVPQAWQDDNAIEVEPQGVDTFDVTLHIRREIGRGAAMAMRDDQIESDELRQLPHVPLWIRDWSGPFRVEVQASIAAHYEATA